MDPPILSLSTRWRTVVRFIAPPLHLQGKIHRYFLYNKLAVKTTVSLLLRSEPQMHGSRTHSLADTTPTTEHVSFTYTVLAKVTTAAYKLR